MVILTGCSEGGFPLIEKPPTYKRVEITTPFGRLNNYIINKMSRNSGAGYLKSDTSGNVKELHTKDGARGGLVI